MNNIGNNSALKRVEGDTSFDTHRVYMLGEKGSGLKPRGELQDFSKLKAHCQKYNKLFTDAQRPLEKLGRNMTRWNRSLEIQWKRPWEFIDDPKFMTNQFSSLNLEGSSINNSWFVSAVLHLIDCGLINFAVPENQNFDPLNYSGIFHFRFWQFGRWINVVVDDLLPTHNNVLVGLQSTNPDEMWPALLEKAYAKLFGSYDVFNGGFVSEALEDFTGGHSVMHIASKTNTLKSLLVKAYESGAYIGCGVSMDKETGSVGAHSYKITKMLQVPLSEKILIRISNPWKEHYNWTGKWTHRSDDFKKLPQELQRKLLYMEDIHQFWIEFTDFQKLVLFVEFTYPHRNLDHCSSQKIQYNCQMIDGAWIKNVNAGGDIDTCTFFANPQYFLELTADSDVKIALMQEDHRLAKTQSYLKLGLAIYKDFSMSSICGLNKMQFQKFPKIETGIMKQITFYERLPKGCYYIIPFVCEQNVSSNFLLRVYCTSTFTLIETKKRVQKKGFEWNDLTEISTTTIDSDPIFGKSSDTVSEIDWKELQKLLNIHCTILNKPSHFSKEQCRTLIAIYNTAVSQKLNQGEFLQLWRRVSYFKSYAHNFIIDSYNCKRMSGSEFVCILEKMNINMSHRTTNLLLSRYGNEDNFIKFEDYIVSMCRLHNAIETFFQHRSKFRGVNFDEWIQTTMSI